MPLSWEQHPDEEALEAYAMGNLSDANSVGVDHHLLLCEECRQQVEQVDGFLRTMRAVVARPFAAPDSAQPMIADYDRNKIPLDCK